MLVFEELVSPPKTKAESIFGKKCCEYFRFCLSFGGDTKYTVNLPLGYVSHLANMDRLPFKGNLYRASFHACCVAAKRMYFNIIFC